MEWSYGLNLEIVGIDKGVKAIALKVEHEKDVYVLCRSYNQFIMNMALVRLDMTGKKKDIVCSNPVSLDIRQESKHQPFLFTGLSIAVHKKEPGQIILRKDNNGDPCLTLIKEARMLTGFRN